MKRIRLFILLFLLSFSMGAQEIIHLCKGDNHNFGIDYNPNSFFQWHIGDSSLASFASADTIHQVTIDLNKAGLFKLFIEEIDKNGCSGYDSIFIKIHELPKPNIFTNANTSFCHGDSIQLFIDSLYGHNIWNNGDTLNYTYVNSDGNFFVIVTDTNGCKDTSNIIYTDVHPNPNADIIIDGSCVDVPTLFIDNSSIVSDSIVSNIWRINNVNIFNRDTISYNYSNADEYSIEIIVFSDFGCKDSLVKYFSVYESPIASFDFFPNTASVLEPEVNFINTTSEKTSSIWIVEDDIDGSGFIHGTYDTSFSAYYKFENIGLNEVKLVITDTNQCVDSLIQYIKMTYDFVFYMPNSFSPSITPSLNDGFGPKGLRMDRYKSYEFIVFNQWGEKVFRTDKIPEYDNEGKVCLRNCWEGKDNQDGVYSWLVIIEDELGAIRKKYGHVTLWR